MAYGRAMLAYLMGVEGTGEEEIIEVVESEDEGEVEVEGEGEGEGTWQRLTNNFVHYPLYYKYLCSMFALCGWVREHEYIMEEKSPNETVHKKHLFLVQDVVATAVVMEMPPENKLIVNFGTEVSTHLHHPVPLPSPPSLPTPCLALGACCHRLRQI